MKDKPAARSGYHHGSLPEALTTAALELVDESGPAGVSVREVARRAGVSPGAPFRHFADRQALLMSVAGRVLADYEVWQREAVAQAEGPATRAFGIGFVRYAIRHPHRFELVKPWVFGPRRPAELDARLSGIEETFAGLVRADQREGTLRAEDPELVALAGQALVYGLSQMIVDGYLPPERAEDLAVRVLDTLGLGIANHAN
ncbi:TetR/AcrR family transcriptional regulator [Streptomyces sp. NPDC048436]|uniref:TetR/AcrR family transcriptional regulator n=1 Tax=Streptomyces sp. NPDC048436 TaxID=3365550 RepID=UPI003713433C